MFFLEFKDIEYVLAISKYHNITKAAESLYVTQPNLSTYIKNMEKRLGITLFKREGNKIDLTFEGEMFLESGITMLQQRDTLMNKLNESVDSERGRLKLSVPLLRGSYLIPLIIPAFQKKYPNVHIILSEGDSTESEKDVKNGVSDLAIFNKPFRKLDLDHEVIYQEEMLLVMHKDHPLSKKAKNIKSSKYPWIDIGLCKNESFIMHSPSQHTGKVERHIFEQADINPNIILETKNFEASVRLVSLNYGLTFICESHIKYISSENNLMFCSVGNPTINMDFIAAYVNKDYLSKYAKDFIKISKECFEQENSAINYLSTLSNDSELRSLKNAAV